MGCYEMQFSEVSKEKLLTQIQRENNILSKSNDLENFEPLNDTEQHNTTYSGDKNNFEKDSKSNDLYNTDYDYKYYPGQRRPKLKSNLETNAESNDIHLTNNFEIKISNTQPNNSKILQKKIIEGAYIKNLNNNNIKKKIKKNIYKNNNSNNNSKKAKSVKSVKYLNSIINTKDKLIDRLHKTKNYFSINKEEKLKCKNISNLKDKNFSKNIFNDNSFKINKNVSFYAFNIEKLKYSKKENIKILNIDNNISDKSTGIKSINNINSTNSKNNLSSLRILGKNGCNKFKNKNKPQKFICVKNYKTKPNFQEFKKNIFLDNKDYDINYEYEKFQNKIKSIKIDYIFDNDENIDKNIINNNEFLSQRNKTKICFSKK